MLVNTVKRFENLPEEVKDEMKHDFSKEVNTAIEALESGEQGLYLDIVNELDYAISLVER